MSNSAPFPLNFTTIGVEMVCVFSSIVHGLQGNHNILLVEIFKECHLLIYIERQKGSNFNLSMQQVDILFEPRDSQGPVVDVVSELPEFAIVLFKLFNEWLVCKWILELL